MSTINPRDIDTQIAELANQQDQALARVAARTDSARTVCGEHKDYSRTRNGKWTTTDAQAIATLRERLNADTFLPTDKRRAQDTMDGYTAAVEEVRVIGEQIDALDDVWRAHRWSRFFLVTSSDGHIHSSQACSTCRPGRTKFGWLPDVSGKTEADAVAQYGPMLCTVCFPTAPTAWTVGKPKDDDGKCPGSLTSQYGASRKGYVAGNWGECNHCGQRITLTKSGNMRSHKK